MSKPRILVIEDDDLQYELYEDALSDYEIVRVRTGADQMRRVGQVLEGGRSGAPSRNSLPTPADRGSLPIVRR